MNRILCDAGHGLRLLGVGALGALLARGVGVPAGTIIGALLGSGLYRLSGRTAGSWRTRYGWLGRFLLGTVIGAAFGPDVVAPLTAAMLPAVFLIGILVALSLGLGWVMSRLAGLEESTALASVVPGGLPAMVAMAEDVGADPTVVAAVHFSRLTAILIVVPILIPFLAVGPDAPALRSVPETVGFWYTAVTLVVGLVGAVLALRLRVPTGDMIGPILMVGGVNLAGAPLGPLDEGFRQLAMLLIGTAVGAQMSRESLRRLRAVALPAAIFIAMIISVGLLLGWGLSLITPLDPVTALLSGVPGGASTMPAVAQDLGGDMRLVAALHLARQMTVFVLVPWLVNHLLRRKGRRCAVSRTKA